MAKTLTQLIASIRQQSNTEKSLFVTDPEITDRINEVRLELYDIMLECDPQFSLAAPSSFTLTSTNSSNLPATFYRLRGVDYVTGSRPVPLQEFNWPERSRYTGGGFAGTYQLWFNPLLVDLVNGSDQLGAIEDLYREFIIQGGAAKVLQKAKKSPDDALALKAGQEKRVRSAMTKRKPGPMQPPDVTRMSWTEDDGNAMRAYSLEGSAIRIWSAL